MFPARSFSLEQQFVLDHPVSSCYTFWMVKTIIIRHVKENRKKCSLTPLEAREDFEFYTYPSCALNASSSGAQSLANVSLDGAILLDFDGPPLSLDDRNCSSLLLLDGTWRYAQTMRKNLPQLNSCSVRRIPDGFVTAYPRKQTDCSEPDAGLASIEALYVAYHILGWDVRGMLDSYYWRDLFLFKNDFK